MILTDLLQDIATLAVSGSTAIDIQGISFDSRTCAPGWLFVAVNGTEADGHRFIDSAIANGAVAVIYETGEWQRTGVTAVKVENSRLALGLAADNFYGHPSSKMEVVGITGTNGKSTTVTLLWQLFTSLGYCCGLFSTIANYIGSRRLPSDHTTPDPVSVHRLMAEMAAAGCQYCFMEISSHSLAQDRIAGIRFKGGIFSNITHDHLDYHKTFAEYLRCKKLFFDHMPQDAWVLTNLDDKHGEVMTQNTRAAIHTYACRRMADFRAKIVEETLDGMELEIDGRRLWCNFIGAHNAYNLLAVYGAAILLGADKEEVLVRMSALRTVAGRLEYYRSQHRDLTAFVDYAHTPDGLENVLKTLRETARDRQLVCVFGCGGDRDKTKRPEMGEIAGKYADRLVVTSDNPRTEDPLAIIEDIKAGLNHEAMRKSIFIADRKEAIRTALMTADEGAVILIAGKGHEDYQIIGTTKIDYDERSYVAELMKEI
jgi:UDP-N-acetylmuramoyl-L-alanyl-D-glutamate--2,6-diaminopimelate ligase